MNLSMKGNEKGGNKMDNNLTYSIGEFSEKTGISIRTLHYYDEIGLLKAKKHPNSGHRRYSDKDILTLQKILSFKYLGYSLNEICKMIKESSFNLSLNDSLQIQKLAFEEKKEQIESVLNTINRTIQLIKDEGEVDSTILISLINSMQTENEQQRWLEQHTTKEVAEQLFNKAEEEKLASDKEFIWFSKEVKRLKGKPFHDQEVQELISKHLKSTFEYVGEEAVSFIQGIEDIEKEKLINTIPSPYTKEEEDWLNQAMEYYMIHNVMNEKKTE